MSQFIDRRNSSKNKSAVNRQRFIRRFKSHIKKAVSNAINKRSITDIYNSEKIIIPKKDLQEPSFKQGKGGRAEAVFPGNKDFSQGDHIQRPPQGEDGAQNSQASNEGEGTDDFVFELSKDEFIEVFFEDLALPNLVKTQLKEIPIFSRTRAGITTQGNPSNINIVRSFRHALGRRIAFGSSYHKKIQILEEQLAMLLKHRSAPDPEISALEKKIKRLKQKKSAIPFLDTIDIRYNSFTKTPQPTTQAVMFCIMDVSGSMDEAKKDIAKRFFIFLYLFLTKNYENIEIVFIRHHTTAKEVNEEEFFYSRETGGTVVSSALELMTTIIQERFPTSDWNIYAAQASDGDNWNADSPHCQKLLLNQIMPYVQYYFYVEIMPRHHQSLWRAYLSIKDNYDNFSMNNINELSDIYPVFHELFKRKVA